MSRSARAQAAERIGGGEGEIEAAHRNAEPAALGPFLGLDADPLLGPLGGGVIRLNGSHPLGHPLGEGQVGAVGLAAEWLPGDQIGPHAEQIDRCGSVTCDPRSMPRPSSRPANPAPQISPGGVPESA